MLVLGCLCPVQPTTPSSGMCGSGAGNNCGSPSQLGTAFPYKAGPRGEEPGPGRPRSCHEAGGWDPHSSGHSNGVRGAVKPGARVGLGPRSPDRVGSRLSFPGPGLGGSASGNYCFCFPPNYEFPSPNLA